PAVEEDDPRAYLPPPLPNLAIEIERPAVVHPRQDNHPFFAGAEQHYSADPVRIRKQAEMDHQLIMSTMRKLDEQRAAGQGRLAACPPGQATLPFFAGAEQHYSADPVGIRKQAEMDHQLIMSTMRKRDEQRAAGQGRLAGVPNVDALAGQAPFLDGHVYVHPL